MSRRVMLSASTWFRFSTLLAHAEASSAMGSLAIVPKCCSSLAPHDKPLSPTRRRRRARLTHGPRSPAARQVDAMGRLLLGEIRGGLLQNLVGAPQLEVLPLELLEPLGALQSSGPDASRHHARPGEPTSGASPRYSRSSRRSR